MRTPIHASVTRRDFARAVAAAGAIAGAGLVASCSSRPPQEGTDGEPATSEPPAAPSADEGAATPAQATNAPSDGSIVAVFSWSGNTLAVADRIAEDLSAELFRIEPETPYTDDYDEMLGIAQDEQAAGTLPAIAKTVADWDAYSTVYLGFPTWWGHLPQIVKSFLAAHDCAGKVVHPFNTHGGSGFASCLGDLAQTCPEADVRDGLSLRGDAVSASTGEIDDWANASR